MQTWLSVCTAVLLALQATSTDAFQAMPTTGRTLTSRTSKTTVGARGMKSVSSKSIMIGQTGLPTAFAHSQSVSMKLGAATSSANIAASSPFDKLEYPPVYTFGKNQKAGNYGSLKFLLGGKGANLADMSAIGLSVPPGFTVTTEVCAAYHKNKAQLPTAVWDEVMRGIAAIENEMGRKFGDPTKPLLVSVRSGAAVSMPGMMDTILNLGLNDETVRGLSANFGEKFAYDSYRRFLAMFGNVVLGIPGHAFESKLEQIKSAVGASSDADLTPQDLLKVIDAFKEVYTAHGEQVVTDPVVQLNKAVGAVFDSWQSDRAQKYREAEGIYGLLGTAVNVQAMVFGNMGPTSGTGVCFSRNPNTGENLLYGEYLINAQGEDVVAGIRTPQPIRTLHEALPDCYDELVRNVALLERTYHDMQDIEFTIQEGKLYMLQTRSGKRGGIAAVAIAVAMVNEGLASKEQAIMQVKPEHLNQLLHPQFVSVKQESYVKNVVAKGLPASPGAAVGKIVFSPDEAERLHAAGEDCILVRDETSPEDVGGMWASVGVLTARGGMTSHAAVVARGWGKPCVCGCDGLQINENEETITFHTKKGPVTLKAGDYLSLNGDTGEVVAGKQAVESPSIDASPDTRTLMGWVDEKRQLRVLANADTPADAAEARRNGAQGIGLTRTEHMFFSEDRIRLVRRMILSKDENLRREALKELLPYQRSDFEGIFEAMDGLGVTVRLIDPPLHEFLPKPADIDESFAKEVGMTVEECRHTIERMQEVNPMLGLRGCRLGVVMPELIEMQARALIEAAINNKARGLDPRPEIMIPLIGSAAEFRHQAHLVRSTIEKVFSETSTDPSKPAERIDYKLGTMIEVPRAALTASEIAEAGAEFFSYGTNDLTQMTYGFSRDDIGTFLPTYIRSGLLETDPFQSIDQAGVGKLIKQSSEDARKVAVTTQRPFKAGVCGEHGGDPNSVKFFARSGMDYVSCSPFRVPVARLAAAQVQVEMENAKK